MDLESIIYICRSYSYLGGAMQDQLDSIIESGDISQCVESGQVNPNALKYIDSFLKEVSGYTGDNSGEIELLIEKIENYKR